MARRQLAPGAWDDGHGGLHIDIEAMLTAAGYANTPENQKLMLEAIRRKYSGHAELLVEIDVRTADEVDEAHT